MSHQEDVAASMHRLLIQAPTLALLYTAAFTNWKLASATFAHSAWQSSPCLPTKESLRLQPYCIQSCQGHANHLLAHLSIFFRSKHCIDHPMGGPPFEPPTLRNCSKSKLAMRDTALSTGAPLAQLVDTSRSQKSQTGSNTAATLPSHTCCSMTVVTCCYDR